MLSSFSREMRCYIMWRGVSFLTGTADTAAHVASFWSTWQNTWFYFLLLYTVLLFHDRAAASFSSLIWCLDYIRSKWLCEYYPKKREQDLSFPWAISHYVALLFGLGAGSFVMKSNILKKALMNEIMERNSLESFVAENIDRSRFFWSQMNVSGQKKEEKNWMRMNSHCLVE